MNELATGLLLRYMTNGVWYYVERIVNDVAVIVAEIYYDWHGVVIKIAKIVKVNCCCWSYL